MSGSRHATRKSLNTRDRLHQVKRFLMEEYGIPVRLRVDTMPKAFKDCVGYISYDNPELPPLIWIQKNLSKSEAVSTLLHEFAHAVSHGEHGPSWKRPYNGHDENFAIVLNNIENRYLYDNGLEESKEW